MQIRPYIGHGFHLLEEGTIWREMFQEMDMYKAVEEKDVLRTYSPASFGDQEVRQRRLDRAQVEYRDTPVCVRVDKHEIPEVRPKGWALQTFSFPGITLHLKVGRWETDGVKEIWELELQKGTKIDWQIPYGDTDLFLVQSGAVRVQADGDHDFVAREHEIVNIPPFYKHTIAAIEENTRLLAYNVQAHLLRILERLQYERIHTPEGWNDWTHIESVLREFDCWVTGVSCEG